MRLAYIPVKNLPPETIRYRWKMSTLRKACPLCYLCAEKFHNRSKFDKVLTKNKFAQFFETRCRLGVVVCF